MTKLQRYELTEYGGLKESDTGMWVSHQAAMTAVEEALAALKRFADAVFNDNGDMTVNSGSVTREDYVLAYNAYRALKAERERL